MLRFFVFVLVLASMACEAPLPEPPPDTRDAGRFGVDATATADATLLDHEVTDSHEADASADAASPDSAAMDAESLDAGSFDGSPDAAEAFADASVTDAANISDAALLADANQSDDATVTGDATVAADAALGADASSDDAGTRPLVLPPLVIGVSSTHMISSGHTFLLSMGATHPSGSASSSTHQLRLLPLR